MLRLAVYSPNGEMFEVQPHVAEKLVVNEGWTFSKDPKPAFKVDEDKVESKSKVKTKKEESKADWENWADKIDDAD